MTTINQNINGNYLVTILSDGTKIRKTNQKAFIPSFPESIDLKITDKCKRNCPWCHEASSVTGKHASPKFIYSYLKDLPPGVELAIGGGDVFEHPKFNEIITSLNNMGFICNTTVSLESFERYEVPLEVHGIGISHDKKVETNNPNVVNHVIAGFITFTSIIDLLKAGEKVLILGYKIFGRGKEYYNDTIRKNIRELNTNLNLVLETNSGTLSFDNLAITQLNLQKHLTNEEWDKFYMGDDGQYTMYVDAVNQKYGKSSTSNRVATATIISDFKKLTKGNQY